MDGWVGRGKGEEGRGGGFYLSSVTNLHGYRCSSSGKESGSV